MQAGPDIERIVTEIIAEEEERAWTGKERRHPNGLRYARSHAEFLAVRQRWLQVGLTAINVILATLTLLRVFGIL